MSKRKPRIFKPPENGQPSGWVTLKEGGTEEICEAVITNWHEMKWDDKGRAWERGGNDKTFDRRPRFKRAYDRDFGTPMGDLIIPPWAQECAKQAKKDHD